jgi:hypothetical protein
MKSFDNKNVHVCKLNTLIITFHMRVGREFDALFVLDSRHWITSPFMSLQSPLLLVAPGGVDCKIASK